MRHETELERWDRNFHELLQELRIAQTGAQILLAFLFALAFAERFVPTTYLWRTVYLLTLAAASIAMILFLAPVSLHRALFRQGRKPRVVVLAARLARAALACVLLAIAGTVFLAVHAMAGAPTAAAFSAGSLLFGGSLWYLLPARERRRARTDRPPPKHNKNDTPPHPPGLR